MISTRFGLFSALTTIAIAGGSAEAKTSVQPLEMTSSTSGTSGGGGTSTSSTTETDDNDGTPDCTSTNVSTSSKLEHSVACGKLWGGHTFGAYYDLDGGLVGNQAIADKWRFDSLFEVGVWIFGSEKVLYSATTFFERNDNGATYGEGYLRIGNDDITSAGGNVLGETGSTDWSRTKTFWRPPAASYWVGPFKLSVQAELAGKLGLQTTTDCASKLDVTATPYGRIYAEATASASVISDDILAVGITGQLTLAEVSLPFAGRARLTADATDTYDFRFDVDLVLTTLSGTLTAWADAFGHQGDGHDVTLQIADWDGLSKIFDVIETRSGSASLR
jgi:hypothetical protein